MGAARLCDALLFSALLRLSLNVMAAFIPLDLGHVYNAINALSADIHRLSEVNRISTINVQNALSASVEEAIIFITTTVQNNQEHHATRAEEMYGDIADRIDTETLEEKMDELERQLEDRPSSDNLAEEMDVRTTRIDNLVKSEYVSIFSSCRLSLTFYYKTMLVAVSIPKHDCQKQR